MSQLLSPMERIDAVMVSRGLVDSRSQAKRLIDAGKVSVVVAGEMEIARKAAAKVFADAEIVIEKTEEDTFVSRAALKLQAGLDLLPSEFCEGVIALDVGQSTGGFTECLLRRGAQLVVGLEVGHDQLSPSLRNNSQVVCLEGVNARCLDDVPLKEYAPHGFDIAVMDVSFISQTLILPDLAPVLKQGGLLVSLVKPQFEVGKAAVGKGGIVKDASLHEQVKIKIEACAQQLGFELLHYIPSPITGGDGNHEFILVARATSCI